MIKVSLIIVEYESIDLTIKLIKSINKFSKNITYEIIVSDNSKKNNENIFKSYAKYIHNKKNLGYGGAINSAVKMSRGKYIFLLNSDVLFLNNCTKILSEFLDKHSNCAVVSPALFDGNNKIYKFQGTSELNVLNAIMSLSFVNKILPHNSFSNFYWQKDIDKNTTREVDVVPGTALMIRKNIFTKIGGFDEKFFLYFEEADLCKRIKHCGYTLFINSEARIIHFWGETTKLINKDELNKIFRKSRFYYFKKHYGVIKAYFVEIFLSIGIRYVIIGASILLLYMYIFYFKRKYL